MTDVAVTFRHTGDDDMLIICKKGGHEESLRMPRKFGLTAEQVAHEISSFPDNAISVTAADINLIPTVHKSWKPYMESVQKACDINFWGNLLVLSEAKRAGDPYIAILEDLGICLTPGSERPLDFEAALNRLLLSIHISQEPNSKKIWPGKMVSIAQGAANAETKHIALTDECLPHYKLENSTLTPLQFFSALDDGLFLMGPSTLFRTSQSSAEHCLAHIIAFASRPDFASFTRMFAGRVMDQTRENSNPDGHQEVIAALLKDTSQFSMRCYLALDLNVYVPKANIPQLEELFTVTKRLRLGVDWASINDTTIINFLYTVQRMHGEETVMKFLAKLYAAFPTLIVTLGGEDLDVVNRINKCIARTGPVPDVDAMSIHFHYERGKSFLFGVRPSKENQCAQVLARVHAPFIGSLLGAALLTMDDWMTASEFKMDTRSGLYHFICDSKIWEKDSLVSASAQDS